MKIFASTIAMDLIPVIPLSKPSNNIFYTDFKFITNEEKLKKRSEFIKSLLAKSTSKNDSNESI